MIKKLQLKFVLICMLSLLVVLSVILVGMNIVNYQNVITEADELLALLSENKGRFPSLGGPGGMLPPHMSPELPYETRYFTVTMDEQTGAIIHIDTGRIAAVDTQDARRFAGRAEGSRGFVEEFRYIRCDEGQQERLIFLDCGRRLDACRDFLLTSVLISLIGYALVFLLVLFFSSRIARPFAESYEKQKRFITDAGHELKTPLTIIRADADVLEMELGKNEWLEDIQRQTARLSALTADLVLLSRMEERTDLPMIEFPISDVVAEIGQSFLAPAQTQGKRLSLQISPMLTIRGNDRAIAQLTSILLDNAVKYAPADTLILLRLEKQGRSILLIVDNETVQPLGKEQLAQLFDRFYRGDSARATQGHGIGLSVAKAIVTAHGGKITAAMSGTDTLRITAQLPATSQ